jgi:hypothetical protein
MAPSFLGAQLVSKCKLRDSVQARDTLTDCFSCSDYSVSALTRHWIRYLPDEQLGVPRDHKEQIADLIGEPGR